MISSRKELREFMRADRLALRQEHPLLARLTYGEHAMIRTYMGVLRHAEYWSHQKGLLAKVAYSYYLLRYRRLCLKSGMYVALDSVGKGFCIEHPGFLRVDSFCRVGDRCTILPMVLMGKKKPDLQDFQIVVGDDCYIGTGATILGPVRIGHNVTIAAGAVVLHDVPDNAVVAGVPAKIVKIGGGKS